MVSFRVAPAAVLMLSVVAVMLCCSLASAQFGPEMYGLIGRFGMGSPVSTRVLAMGGQVGCINDQLFANPAFAAVQLQSNAGVRGNLTEFDNGPDVTTALVHAMVTLKPDRQGVQVMFLDLDSSSGAMVHPLAGPVTTKLFEKTVVVDFGQRLSDRLTAGLSVLGHRRAGLSIVSGLGPLLISLGDKSAYGFRGAVAYELAPDDYAGAVFNYAREEVTTAGVAALPGKNFDSYQFVLGASRHVTPQVLLAAEWQHGVLEATGFKSSVDTLHFGAEYRPTPQWGLRAGLSDGNISCGLGWSGEKWRADYAFINNWNDDDAKQLFGGSATHSFEVMLRW